MNDFASARPSGQPALPLIRSADSYPVLDAETQSFLDHAAEAAFPAEWLPDPVEGDGTHATPIEEAVLQANAAGPAFTIRVVRPRQALSVPSPAVLYLPGARASGGSGAQRCQCVAHRIATDARATVVIVDYTPAPAVRFSTQNAQALAALAYLHDHARAWNVDEHALVVAGDGTGGNLAASVALLAKVRRGPRIALQILLCPILSADATTASATTYADGPGLTAEVLRRLMDTHVSAEGVDDELAMPLDANYTDLEDLPPALIVTAESDVARDGGEAYARKLMLAGVRVSAVRCLGTIHDFTVLDGLAETPPTDAALRLVCGAVSATRRGY
ncbi:lipase [Burkholderia ubonensis]|uniref:alpha/beta hydrolase fold domain-containing protein n=1 Tax=Burkholderia ubonensis TaxID=101571 RepID=UPI00075D1B5B|nr:alpha/beta hydrolase fold domain-containing protein [Burkholderia ubonensis]KVR16622.1 lipase [Burkholderia ubonensis]